MNEDFDLRAKDYDTKQKLERARELGEHIIETWKGFDHFPEKVFDFGCGTGQVTFEIQPHVKEIYAFDRSGPMGEKFKKKIAERGLTNVHYLESMDGLEGGFDCVLSSLVFHHLKDITAEAAALKSLLKPGGHLTLIELDTDDGRFHADTIGGFDGYNGFDRAWLAARLVEAGYKNVRYEQCHSGAKLIEGEPHPYTMFCITGEA